jgi:hypothetical protein
MYYHKLTKHGNEFKVINLLFHETEIFLLLCNQNIITVLTRTRR